MIELETARDIGAAVMNLISPACERMELAGSIRRRKGLVKDVEIVCVPRMVADMHRLIQEGELSALDAHVKRICERPGPLKFDPALKRDGSRYKRLEYDGSVKVDLFIVLPPAAWGALMAIRTGPGEFSHLLVTSGELGGAMPVRMQQREGALWLKPPDDSQVEPQRIDTPEEEDYFAALGLPCWAPGDRTVGRLRWFLDLPLQGQQRELERAGAALARTRE